ncbi:DMT family transporter [Roseateles toxinivorans]|nr:DMT family transporter [Roseateles toxinivorans]
MSNALTTHPLPAAAGAAAEERQGLWLMVACGLLLATIGVFVEEAGQDPLTTVWFRCAFGLLALMVWGAATGRLGELRLRGRALLAALAASLLILANWALFFAAISRTSIGVATVVVHVHPLWLMLLGAWWLRERITRLQIAAVLLALAGLTLATGLLEGDASSGTYDKSYAIGLLMCLAGALCYASMGLIVKLARGISSFALAWWQCLVGTVLLSGWPLLHGWPAMGPAWGWLAGLGIIHTGLAYVLLYAGMARLPTSRVALLQFVYPAAAVLIDWGVYGHAQSPLQLLGIALMGAALLSLRRPAAR